MVDTADNHDPFPAFGGAVMVRRGCRAWISTANVDMALAEGFTLLEDRRNVERPCFDGAPQGPHLLDGQVTVGTDGYFKVTHSS